MIQVGISSDFIQNQGISKINFKPVQFKRINAADTISFSSGRIRVQKGKLEGELKEKVFDLVNNPENYENICIGKGANGKAYKLSVDGRGVVVKIAKKKKDTGIDKEAEILEKLPPSLRETGQGLIAYGLNKDGYEFLVTNFVQGKNRIVPQNKEQIQSILLGNFFELDKAGIIHNDLSENNILINTEKSQANLIDYGRAYGFDIFKTKDERLLDNIMLDGNLMSFETQGICEYFIRLSQNSKSGEARAFLSNYLDVKADYHGERVKFLNTELAKRASEPDLDIEKIKNCIEYEKTLSKVLKNPSDEMIDLEALRLQMLYYFTSTTLFEHKPASAVSSWMKTVMYARKYKETIQQKLDGCKENSDMKKYLEFQKQYAEHCFNSFSTWAHGAIIWILDVFSNPNKKLKEEEKTMLQNGIQNPLAPPDNGVEYFPDTMDIVGAIKK